MQLMIQGPKKYKRNRLKYVNKVLTITFLILCQWGLLNNVSAQVMVEDIHFQTKTFDFGTVSFGKKPIPLVYRFTNNSDKALKINKVVPSCGCTDVQYPKNPVRPGEQGQITAIFDPTLLAGEVDKHIDVYANFKNAYTLELTFKGTILEPKAKFDGKIYPGQFGYLRLQTYAIALGDIYSNQTYETRMEIYNDYNRALDVVRLTNLPSYVTYEVNKKKLQPGDTAVVIITIDGSAIQDFGTQVLNIKVNTTDVFFKTKSFQLVFNVKEDFSDLNWWQRRRAPQIEVSDTAVKLGRVQSGAKVSRQITVTNSGKTPLEIYKVKTECRCTVSDLPKKNLEPKESMKVTLYFDTVYANGNKAKTLTFYTNDPKNHVLEVKLYAEVFGSSL
jgi:hypothetical protein